MYIDIIFWCNYWFKTPDKSLDQIFNCQKHKYIIWMYIGLRFTVPQVRFQFGVKSVSFKTGHSAKSWLLCLFYIYIFSGEFVEGISNIYPLDPDAFLCFIGKWREHVGQTSQHLAKREQNGVNIQFCGSLR